MMPPTPDRSTPATKQSRAHREALAAEDLARRMASNRARWLDEGAYLSYDEFVAGAPCRGCGEPLLDGRPAFGPTNKMTDEELTERAEELARHKETHRSCGAGSWFVGRNEHCLLCCPMPPLSPGQISTIRTLLSRRAPASELVLWELHLRCGHFVEQTCHQTSRPMSATVSCPTCDEVRGVVSRSELPAPPGESLALSDQTAPVRNQLAEAESALIAARARVRALRDQLRK